MLLPGDPTSRLSQCLQVLTRENIETIIKFAHRHRLFLMADEVYQDNIYAPGSKFYSFKKVMTEMGEPYNKPGPRFMNERAVSETAARTEPDGRVDEKLRLAWEV
ncbi:unnamed protein product [Nippostrongylus brasiliensis]|uniref:alanine transaminase n=1 Tax=Nippostrongylus brasiliensis TaxID=27835 RepID=A0A0N4YZF4_NIPBR|nr:unnamed protein product [Nippostrongylus brasiliensis]